MFFTKETFLSARFTSDLRDNIEVKFQDRDQVSIGYVEVNAEDPTFKNLLTMTTVDEIEQNTLDFIDDQRQAILNFHKKLIESGIAQTNSPTSLDHKTLDTDLLSQAIMYHVFNPLNFGMNEKHEEQLFSLKLAVFNDDDIAANLTDDEKESLRSAETMLEFFRSFPERWVEQYKNKED